MILKPERRQLRYDFGFAPQLAETYFPDAEYEGGLKMIRQVNGVTTYLSQMATGDHRMIEGCIFAAAIAGMDVVTDYYHEELYPDLVNSALDGNPRYDCLKLLPVSASLARGPKYKTYIKRLAGWQDESLHQFDERPVEWVRDVTKYKGATSALAHLHALKENPSEREEEVIEEFGYLMQLLDDYLDKPKDEKAGISTVFTMGEMNVVDLCRKREDVLEQLEALYGPSPALSRFGKVTRAHIKMGDLENTTPISASTVLPWYF